MPQVVVIGAGVGGLTAAAVLAKAGLDVTLLEAHSYPGGCAGTFYYQGYRFDAGATLAGGFYPEGPMDLVAQAAGIPGWNAHPADPSIAVHLPESDPILLTNREERWETRQKVFGPDQDGFWRWQESTADRLWELALKLPPWPPQSLSQVVQLVEKGLPWLVGSGQLSLYSDAFRSLGYHLRSAPRRLRQFVDAQLLISAQTTSSYANALYGASALDLPRRGVVHLEGGMGAIAQALEQALCQNGGRVHYHQEANHVFFKDRRPAAVQTKKGVTFPADLVVFNLPVWNIFPMLEEPGASSLRKHFTKKELMAECGWSAFVVYVGLDGRAIPKKFPLHHQIIQAEPLGEGNSVFLSLSPDWDKKRAPDGRRALTLSTHTALGPWWQMVQNEPAAYEACKDEYVERLLRAAEVALPGIRQATKLVLSGTPVTFQRFTRRRLGWVGGFPQTSLFRSLGPRLGPGLWMVGDSIFPGQSTPSVAMGGLRVAKAIQENYRREC